MPRIERPSQSPEAERNRRIDELTQAVERVANRMDSKPFKDGKLERETDRRFNSRGRLEEFTIAERQKSIDGKRFKSGDFSVSVWTEERRSWGKDSDYPFNYAYRKRYLEVRQGRKVVFERTATVQSNNGWTLSLIDPDPKNWIWSSNPKYIPGRWEDRLQRLAARPKNRRSKAA